ncbi:DMT family transporter [Nocardioides acrostichi]|uniref:DMT family transporter n=1 Tax=Nocardioides acrostichi TaxID=2784339 RepID=A0A930YBE7_9ACTN|nr:DMT family transporter [Nocardioides acrostichi]MBF4162398.1 DMT family transporter [Nocardioides acrostichi]
MTATSRETELRVPLLPAAAFVVVWSSGYIAGPAGVDAIDPFTVLTLRFVVAALMLWPVARVLRGPLRITREDLVRVTVSGLLFNALLFGLMYLAFERGLTATLGSLLHSLSPVLTAVLAGVFLHERLARWQVIGFAAGVGGVVLVLGPDVSEAGGVLAMLLGVASLLCLSLGTLGQRWISPHTDPIWSATLQCAVSVPPLAVLALTIEGVHGVHHPVQGTIAVLWLAGVNSVLGLLLIGTLVRRGGAGASASVFFLMPPVTAVMAFVCLGDTLGVRELVGLAVSVAGVAVATRARPGPLTEGEAVA